MPARPSTLGALRQSPWGETPLRGRSVRDELRGNVLRRLKHNDNLFPNLVGFADSVIPQVENALLARHDFILLGTRGQAKTRLLRGLTAFLDDEIPIVAGSEINDDPFAPISRASRDLIAERGDALRRQYSPNGRADADVEPIVAWFNEGGALKVGTDERTEVCWRGFGLVPGLLPLVHDIGLATPDDHATTVAACELALEAMAAAHRISRSDDHGWTRPKPSRRRSQDAGGDFGL